MFNVGIPAFFLAFEPNDKKQEGRFINSTLVKSLPAALTSFFAIALLVLFSILFEIPEADVSTASTYLLAVVGFLILWDIIRPVNKYRVLIFIICILGFIIGCTSFYHLFSIESISLKATALCIVFAIAEVTVMRHLTLVINSITNLYHKLRLKLKKNK